MRLAWFGIPYDWKNFTFYKDDAFALCDSSRREYGRFERFSGTNSIAS